MNRFAEICLVACVAALALAAMAAADASAAMFTYSETGELTGVQTSNQVFTTEEGSSSTVTCKKAHATGTVGSTDVTQQEYTFKDVECTENVSDVGTFAVDEITATYNLKANGEVEIKNNIAIKVTGLGCQTTVTSPQTMKSVSYTNNSGKLEVTSAIKGIVSKGEGLCPGGTSGTFTGSSLIERIGGGTISWDA